MTASNKINKYYCGGGNVFEMWLEAYGFTITNSNEADVIVIDYKTWQNTIYKFCDNPLVIVLSSYSIYDVVFPSNTLLKLIPIDYQITVEEIIRLLKLKQIVMTSNN